MQKESLRALVRSFYDMQKLRIMAGNRLVANVRVRLGQEPGTLTEDMDQEAKDLLDRLAATYRRITDGLSRLDSRAIVKALATADGVIADVFEFELTRYYLTMLRDEEELGRSIARLVAEFRIWKEFLEDVRGCGPITSAVVISELDPHKARHISSFWKYAGLDVSEGKGRSRKAEHLVDVEYTTSDGEQATRKSITFNPFLKTKLVGVLASSFLRSASPYREYYDNYKTRLENRPDLAEESKGHRHNMAMRYMVKMFLKDLWLAWRVIEGLPVEPDYAEAKLGIRHGIANRP
jgi:hypothetical protein